MSLRVTSSCVIGYYESAALITLIRRDTSGFFSKRKTLTMCARLFIILQKTMTYAMQNSKEGNSNAPQTTITSIYCATGINYMQYYMLCTLVYTRLCILPTILNCKYCKGKSVGIIP